MIKELTDHGICAFKCGKEKNSGQGNERENAAISENVMAGNHRAHKT